MEKQNKEKKDQEIVKLLEDKIGYIFKNKNMALTAVTHRSYSNEHDEKNNERLEFLGDSILDFIIASELFFLGDEDEGNMTKRRSYIVCEDSLFKIAKKTKLYECLRVGNSEEKTKENSPSMLSDMIEAIIGAIYVDGGIKEAAKFIKTNFDQLLKEALDMEFLKNYKSLYQEIAQAEGVKHIEYKLVSEKGPDHSKTFEVNLIADGKYIAKGQGKSKKEAQFEAAKYALNKMNVIDKKDNLKNPQENETELN